MMAAPPLLALMPAMSAAGWNSDRSGSNSTVMVVLSGLAGAADGGADLIQLDVQALLERPAGVGGRVARGRLQLVQATERRAQLQLHDCALPLLRDLVLMHLDLVSNEVQDSQHDREQEQPHDRPALPPWQRRPGLTLRALPARLALIALGSLGQGEYLLERLLRVSHGRTPAATMTVRMPEAVKAARLASRQRYRAAHEYARTPTRWPGLRR